MYSQTNFQYIEKMLKDKISPFGWAGKAYILKLGHI